MEEELLSGTISLAMKINLGNYESADAFISLSNITEQTTRGEVESLLNGKMRISYELLRGVLVERIKAIKLGDLKEE